MHQCLKIENKIDIILKSSKQSILLIKNLVNDLLDYAKLENATLKLFPSYFNFQQIIDKGIAMMFWQAKEKSIAVSMTINPLSSKYLQSVYGDQLRISRIFLNLLSNSIKFTPFQGRIQIFINVRKIKYEEEKSSKSVIQAENESVPLLISLQVEDNGPGISKENLSKLFINFGTLSEHEQNNPQGTGLGLSICKLLAQKMNGTVYAESELGKGTSFIFTFNTHCMLREGQEDLYSPENIKYDYNGEQENRCTKSFPANKPEPINILNQKTPEKEAKQKNEEENQDVTKHKRISALVADDENYCLQMVETFLKSNSLKVKVAHEGNEAFNIFTKFHFDILFLDLYMPYLNGFELSKKISEYCRTKGRRKPIITLLTANVENNTSYDIKECGIDYIIHKPLDRQNLREILTKFQHQSS